MLIPVTESSQAGEARRRAIAAAENMNLGEGRCGAVALATTELATNLVKHAKSGYILLQQIHENGVSGLRVISVDKGPGIRDISSAFTDGHSTAGTLGSGLGAVRRASSRFDVYSTPDAGTILLAEFWNGGSQRHPGELKFEIGVVSEPMAGEEVCGDGWAVRRLDRGVLAMVVDGLGHGLSASDAAREAERTLGDAPQESVTDILHDLHNALRKTRGAAAALARIDSDRHLLFYTGVGNIATSVVVPGSSRSLPSHNGILGEKMERVQEFTLPWNDDALLVMHSDGLSSKWNLDRYPGIWGRHPSLVAALLHRDFCRGRDDVTILVARCSVSQGD